MPSSRRLSTSALAPLAALALLGAGFLIVRPDHVPEAAPAPTPAAKQTSAPPGPGRPSPKASTRPPELVASPTAARAAGRRFLADYLRLLHGGGSARALRQAAPELRRELRRHPPRATPAQQTRRSTIRGLDVTLQGPSTARAIATLQAAGGPPYPVRLYLERRGSRWLVTRIGDA